MKRRYAYCVITELRLQNARIYDQKEWRFPLSGLTILCGTNSAGKSTVLKSLLLLRQSVLFRDPSFSSQTGPRLRFSDNLIDLGNFRSFVSHNDTQKELHLGISIDAEMSPDNYRQLDGMAKGVIEDDGSDGELEEAPLTYKFDADFYFGVKQNLISLDAQRDKKQLQLQIADSEEDSATEHRAILKLAIFAIKSDDGNTLIEFRVVRRQTESRGSASDYYLILPKALFESSPELQQSEFSEETDSQNGSIRVFMPGIYPDRAVARPKNLSSQTDELAVRAWPLPGYMDEAFSDLRSAMNRIVYLGPLRAPAKRYYPVQADYGIQADVTGELLPYLLRDRMNAPVYNALPGNHSPSRPRLFDALNGWLYYMRTGIQQKPGSIEREIKIDSMQDVLVELGIKDAAGKETHALADSGFGYSQLLPILVRGLMLAPTGTLIVEQPEVHLNPALQVRLSEFLVAMASLGKQILLETHSEHIVNAVRAISAEKASPELSHKCTVLYLEASGGRPALHKLSVLPDGTVPDWPQSFFGEAAQTYGRILRAQKYRKDN